MSCAELAATRSHPPRSSRINSTTRSLLSEQHTLFRINCVDCLDRTNVVQAALAKAVLEMMVNSAVLLAITKGISHSICNDFQLKKLGLLDLDDGGLTGHSRSVFQTMWADNGDAISRQYAGTDAMKVTDSPQVSFTEENERAMNPCRHSQMRCINQLLFQVFQTICEEPLNWRRTFFVLRQTMRNAFCYRHKRCSSLHDRVQSSSKITRQNHRQQRSRCACRSRRRRRRRRRRREEAMIWFDVSLMIVPSSFGSSRGYSSS